MDVGVWRGWRQGVSSSIHVNVSWKCNIYIYTTARRIPPANQSFTWVVGLAPVHQWLVLGSGVWDMVSTKGAALTTLTFGVPSKTHGLIGTWDF